MKEMIAFELNIDPPRTTAQTHRYGGKRPDGRLIFFDSDKLKAARNTLRTALLPHKPAEPMEGAIRLQVFWRFPTKDKKKWGTPKITRPDTDNLQKMLKDEMTRLGFWNDDAQVCDEHVRKRWAERGSISILVVPYE